MRLRTVVRLAPIALLGLALSSCDQVKRDVGADVAACNLEEMKTNYPDKANNWRDLGKAIAAGDEQNKQALFKILAEDKLKYVSLCMRARGWQLKPENHCLQKDADMPNCYEPATPSRDGLISN